MSGGDHNSSKPHPDHHLSSLNTASLRTLATLASRATAAESGVRSSGADLCLRLCLRLDAWFQWVESREDLKPIAGKLRTIDKEVVNWVLRQQGSENRQWQIRQDILAFGGNRFHQSWKDTPDNVLHTLNTFRTEARWLYENLYAGRTKLSIHRSGSCEQRTIEECYRHLEEYHYGRDEEEEISAFAEDTFGVDDIEEEEGTTTPTVNPAEPKDKMSAAPGWVPTSGGGVQAGESSRGGSAERIQGNTTVKFPTKIDVRSLIKYSGEPQELVSFDVSIRNLCTAGNYPAFTGERSQARLMTSGNMLCTTTRPASQTICSGSDSAQRSLASWKETPRSGGMITATKESRNQTAGGARGSEAKETSLAHEESRRSRCLSSFTRSSRPRMTSKPQSWS